METNLEIGPFLAFGMVMAGFHLQETKKNYSGFVLLTYTSPIKIEQNLHQY